MSYQKIVKIAAILLIGVLLLIIIKFGKPFLVPLTFAALLSMVLLPLCAWLQKKGINKAIASILSILVLLVFFSAVIAFVSWQVSDLTKDASNIEKKINETYTQAQQYISNTFGISEQKQNEVIEKQQNSSSGKLSAMVTGILSGIGGFLTNTILMMVYIFLFLYFRQHLKRFITRLVPEKDKSKAVEIMDRSQGVTQKYLTGLFFMIVILWIMYGIGFSVVGVKNAIFFAILCGVLEIIPFVGNVLGTSITIIMALIQGGGGTMVLGILGIYAFVQFIQTYLLEPLIVGAEVNINPLATIVALVAGEFIWGLPGMVVAIPLMGMAKIVFDHIEPLKPYGELIGEAGKKENKGFKKKMHDFVNNFKSRLGKK